MCIDALRIKRAFAKFKASSLTVAENLHSADALAAGQRGCNLFHAVTIGIEHDDFALLMRVQKGLQAFDPGINEYDFVAGRDGGDPVCQSDLDSSARGISRRG